MPNMLHITNGESVAGTLRESTVTGIVSVWADPLWEGPVQGDLDDDGFLENRARYLAHNGSYDEVLTQLKRWRAAILSAANYEEVVLWFEHDLFDQLLLIQLLDWFGRLTDLADTRLSLICIGEYPDIPKFYGLGQLTADQLAPLLDKRVAITDSMTTLASTAWRAFTSPDPTGLETVLQNDAAALPFLADALRRYLEEFPSTRNGLARSEQQALRAVAEHGPASAIQLFRATQDMEDRPFMGDLSFWSILHRLAAPPNSLLKLDGEQEDDPKTMTVEITDLGRFVLDGKQDWIELQEIDRWLGGVHLTNNSLWRWNGRHLVRR